MNTKEFTFLEEVQIFGDNKLDIFKKYSTKCVITDFSILLGGKVSHKFCTTKENALKERISWWWTKTPAYKNARIVYEDGFSYWDLIAKRNGGARPVLPYSSIASIFSNGTQEKNGNSKVEYGEYPQDIVPEESARILERAFNNLSHSDTGLEVTGKSYTTDSCSRINRDVPFQERTHIEYRYNGRKYVRFVGDLNCSGEVLSDGRTIEEGKPYWVSVEPIKWLIEEEKDIALAERILFAGIPFHIPGPYKGNFEETTIYRFMNTHFIKDIVPSREPVIEEYQPKRLKPEYELYVPKRLVRKK